MGEAAPGPSYLDPELERAGERLHEPQHDVHDLEPHAPRADAQGQRRHPGLRQPAQRVGRRLPPAPRTPRTASVRDGALPPRRPRARATRSPTATAACSRGSGRSRGRSGSRRRSSCRSRSSPRRRDRARRRRATSSPRSAATLRPRLRLRRRQRRTVDGVGPRRATSATSTTILAALRRRCDRTLMLHAPARPRDPARRRRPAGGERDRRAPRARDAAPSSPT